MHAVAPTVCSYVQPSSHVGRTWEWALENGSTCLRGKEPGLWEKTWELGKVNSSAWEKNVSWHHDVKHTHTHTNKATTKTDRQTNKLVIGSSIQVYEELSRFWHISGTIHFCPDPVSCLSLHKGELPCDREVTDNSNNPSTYHATSSHKHISDIYWEQIWCLCLDAPESLDWWSCFHRLQTNA